MRVRTGRFRSGGQGFPPPHGMTRRPCPRHPMLPSGPALTGVLARRVSSVPISNPWSDASRPVQPFMIPKSSGLFVDASLWRLPACRSLLWPLLTSCGISSAGSPQVRTRCSPAQPPHLPPRADQSISLCGASSSRRVGLLCGSCPSARRFPIAFLPPGRSPFRSWLLVVVGAWFFPCLVFLQGT